MAGTHSSFLEAHGACPPQCGLPLCCALPPGGGWSERLRAWVAFFSTFPSVPQGQGRLLVLLSPDPSHDLCSKRCPDEIRVREAEPRWRKTTTPGVPWACTNSAPASQLCDL